MCFLSAGAAAWKNFSLADCVFWAEAVHDSGGGVEMTGFTRATSTGASSTEEGRGFLALMGGPVGPFLLKRLQSCWWALQTKVSGPAPGLKPPACSTLEHSLHLREVYRKKGVTNAKHKKERLSACE